MYFGRNLDWSCSFGERVCITPGGYSPVSHFGAIERTEYPLIGMGIVADGTPLYFDCANSEGLAIAGLNFPGFAQYEAAPVEGKTNVAAYEFPLWVAGLHKTVDEVEAELPNVAIVDKTINDNFQTSLLHWIIGDATRSIVVEYTPDGMHVFHDDVDVLANQPGFAWQAENLRGYLNVTSDVPPTRQWRTAQLTPYGIRRGHARHSGRLLFPIALRALGIPECQLSRQGFRAGERGAPVPFAGRRIHGGRRRAYDGRRLRGDRVHRRILLAYEHVLLLHVRQPCH